MGGDRAFYAALIFTIAYLCFCTVAIKEVGAIAVLDKVWIAVAIWCPSPTQTKK